MKELHCKLVKNLLETNHIILYPEFPVSKLVRKEKKIGKDENEEPERRKLSKENVRKLLGYKFHQFKQRLLFKSKEYPHSRVVICTEEYTSKTCGKCGVINEKLGTSKHFLCEACGYEADRDVNGAKKHSR